MSRNEFTHNYGPQVHLIDNVYLNGLLARLCSVDTFQPEINHLVNILYSQLLIHVMNNEFPKENFECETRMHKYHPTTPLTGVRLKHSQKSIVVNLARAGTYPSHICFDTLHYAIHHEFLRQDHIFAARMTNDSNQVTGTEIGASKIGGDKENAIILFPDPMGATGNTIISALSHYSEKVLGHAQKMIALHLIVTPEYLKNVLSQHPNVIIYALRLDRGLSAKAILESPLGKFWEKEKGLNENDYIVPGGGGFGEIMNNSFV